MARSVGLRVLFVAPGDGRGSSMIFVRREAEHLRRAGVEVESFYLASRTRPIELVREFRRLRAHIRRFRPDLVHAHFGTATAAFAALGAARLPLVITYRGGDLNPGTGSLRGWPRRALAHLLSQLAALRAARLICVSRRLKQRLWWRRKRVKVLPTGVDCELFQPEAQAEARARLGWREDQAVALFYAGGDPQNKRLDLAEGAVEVARRIDPRWRLEVLSGVVEPGLVPTYMNASDCLLITSDQEGSPAILQEALACGLPVVSVDVGDAVERLRGVRPSRIVARDGGVIGRALVAIGAGARSNGPQAAAKTSLAALTRALGRVYARALEDAKPQGDFQRRDFEQRGFERML